MHLYRWSRTSPVSNFQLKIKSSRNFYSKLSVLNVVHVMLADCFYLEIVLRFLTAAQNVLNTVPVITEQWREEQNREEGEMAQTKLGGGRNRGKK